MAKTSKAKSSIHGSTTRTVTINSQTGPVPENVHLSEQLLVLNWNLPSDQERSENFARRLTQLIELRAAINEIVGAVHRYESTPSLLNEDAELWLATLDAILDCNDPSLWPTVAARRELFELCNQIARKLERISSVLLIPLEQHIRPVARQLDAIVSLQQQYFPVVPEEQHFREIDLLEQIPELHDYVLCSTDNLNRRFSSTTSETPQKPTCSELTESLECVRIGEVNFRIDHVNRQIRRLGHGSILPANLENRRGPDPLKALTSLMRAKGAEVNLKAVLPEQSPENLRSMVRKLRIDLIPIDLNIVTTGKRSHWRIELKDRGT